MKQACRTKPSVSLSPPDSGEPAPHAPLAFGESSRIRRSYSSWFSCLPHLPLLMLAAPAPTPAPTPFRSPAPAPPGSPAPAPSRSCPCSLSLTSPTHKPSCSYIQTLPHTLFPAFKTSRSCSFLRSNPPAPAHRSYSCSCSCSSTPLLLQLLLTAPAPAFKKSRSCSPLLTAAQPLLALLRSTPARPPARLLQLALFFNALLRSTPAHRLQLALLFCTCAQTPAPTKQLPSCAQPLLLPNSRPPAPNLCSPLLHAHTQRKSYITLYVTQIHHIFMVLAISNDSKTRRLVVEKLS